MSVAHVRISINAAAKSIARIEARARQWDPASRRTALLKAHAARERARLEELLRLLPESERQQRERLQPLADRAYMTKMVAGRIEVYDARHAFLAAVAAADQAAFRALLAERGKVVEGRHPAYTGGMSRAPGLALWWRTGED